MEGPRAADVGLWRTQGRSEGSAWVEPHAETPEQTEQAGGTGPVAPFPPPSLKDASVGSSVTITGQWTLSWWQLQ